MTVSTAFGIDLSELSAKELSQLARIPAYKNVVLNFKHSLATADIDFSNQTSFVIGSMEYSLADVVYFALSNLSLAKDNEFNNTVKFPKLAERKSEAWNTLKRIQTGKEAQGMPFSLATEALREVVEASL